MTAVLSSAAAELSEAEAFFDAVVGAPEHVRAALGIAGARVGGGVAVSMRRDPTRFWSRALGFGFDTSVTADLIEEVCDFYRAQESPVAVLQMAPSVLPENWPEICAKAGLSAGSTWLKLAGETDVVVRHAAEPGRPSAGVRVAPVENGQADTWASVMLRAFGMPEGSLAEMAASAVGRPGWHPFAAWDGAELVGGGAMHVHQGTAQFFSGATLPHARGRGGQSALLVARARAAQAAGCRWLVAETGAETPGSRNSSLHNVLRLGFRVLYERQDWIWRPTGSE
jgi:GNAT superfamily N-acetyltransferase